MKKLVLLLVVCMFVSCITGCESKKDKKENIVREVHYQVVEGNDMSIIPTNISVDGNNYVADRDSIQILEKVEKEVVIQNANVNVGDLSEIEDKMDFEIDGQIYTFEKIGQKTQKQRVDVSKLTKVEYNDLEMKEEDIPSSLPMVCWVDGEKQQLMAKLVNVDKTDDYWDDNLVIEAFFNGDKDTEYFKIGDDEIYINASTPEFDNFEEVVLRLNNLDLNNYRLSSGNWTSDYHKLSNGSYQRKAEFLGSRRNKSFVASYSLEYQSDGYSCDVTYALDASQLNTEDISKTKVYDITALISYNAE